ncbi:AAA family ATPase [Alkalihalobacterium bogoriense]|uniref:AAA family ATPase n=1 Tax=Alkalihalobacterium bogoriense TaxID=246272 RepID=UPI000479E247|nr:SbcC/MukB-like Walker B domain-containing protein [Alkalihalobacterium bogoriense]
MKPIQLKVAGLHSFREEQTIDFTKLCEGGVFGIFGPTGSGKSSLLDAMTLALYGKVERATNNTQGIMNHAEDLVFVSFTFELSNQEGAKRFQVERSFKRTGDNTVKTAHCRFVEKQEETIVLADKTNEVNQAVQDLLGLSIDDFTRAVVLPQGKFAEFLSLKGTERRQMLQRLFHLEKYGDELHLKLRSRLQRSQNERNEIQAEQAGLGDASKEALEEAMKRSEDCEKKVQESQEALKDAEKTLEHTRKIWEWQSEKQQALIQRKQLEQESSLIETYKQTIALHEQASRLFPYVEELKESEQKKVDWTRKFEHAQTQEQHIARVYEGKEEAYGKAKTAREQNEPIWLVKQEQFTRALELTQWMAQEQKQVDESQEAVKAVQHKLKNTEEQIEKETQIKAKGEQRQNELQQQLTELAISTDERDQMYEAIDGKKTLDQLLKRQSDLETEYKEKREQLRIEEDKENEWKTKLEAGKEKIVQLFFKTDSLFQVVCATERKLEQFASVAKLCFENEKRKVEEQKVHHLALQLSEQLKPGQPCPVCGSEEHQNKSRESEPLVVNEQKQQHLEQWQRDVIEWQHQVKQGKWQLERISEDIMNDVSNDEIDLPAATVDVEKEAAHQLTYEELEGQRRTIESEMKNIMNNVAEIDKVVKAEIMNYRQATEKRKQFHVIGNERKQELQSIAEKGKENAEKIKRERTRWEETFPLFSLATLQEAFEKMKETERQAEDVKKRLEASIPFLEQKEKDIQRLFDARNELSREEASLVSQVEQMEKALQQKQSQLESIVGDQDPNELLVEVKQQLKQLKVGEEIAYKEYEKVRQQWQEAKQQYAIAKEAKTEAVIRYEHALKKWHERQADSSFATAESVVNAILPIDESNQIIEKIETYTDKVKQVYHTIEKLDEALQGRTITEEEWYKQNELVHEGKEALHKAREEKGAAIEAVKELSQKHERYTKLETRREELNKKIETYGKLQTVMRGNAFVEFMAEEQLVQVSREASERLLVLTRGRYAIEVDSAGGFIIRDDANGGIKRPVTSLSGGETFLTSLALALSLSSSIQLRGQFPLEFFFLDEGFGTLDQDLLDTVVTSLEKLHTSKLSVGIISHVPELQARLPRKLMVTPAEPSGKGSAVSMESM